MKITVATDELKRALGSTGKAVVSGGTSLPVLTLTHLTAEDGSLTLAGTDLVVGITHRVDATIERAGEALVDGRLLLEWLQSVPDTTVSLETQEKTFQTTVRAGRSSTVLKGLDPGDMPAWPRFDDQNLLFEIPGDQLRRMIAQTAFAAARDESRPVLAGVHLEVSPGSLEMSAADGFRMSYIDDRAHAPQVDDTVALVISRRAMVALAGLELDGSTVVRVAKAPTGGAVVATIGPHQWLGRLIDGTFPNVAQLVPRDLSQHHRVSVSRDDLVRALRGLRSIASLNNDVVVLTVRDGAVRIAATSTIGEADAEVTAEVRSPGSDHPEDVALNVKYLLEALPSFPGGTVEISILDPRRQVVMSSPADDTYRHVVMPMIVGG